MTVGMTTNADLLTGWIKGHLEYVKPVSESLSLIHMQEGLEALVDSRQRRSVPIQDGTTHRLQGDFLEVLIPGQPLQPLRLGHLQRPDARKKEGTA